MKHFITALLVLTLSQIAQSQIVTKPKDFEIDIDGNNCTVRVTGKFYVSSYADGLMIIGWTDKEILSYTNRKGKTFSNSYEFIDKDVEIGNPSAWVELHYGPYSTDYIELRVWQMLKWSGSGGGNAFDAAGKDYLLFENARIPREFSKEEFQSDQYWFISSRPAAGDQEIYCSCKELENYFETDEYYDLLERGDDELEKGNKSLAISYYNRAKSMAEIDPKRGSYAFLGSSDHYVEKAQEKIQKANSINTNSTSTPKSTTQSSDSNYNSEFSMIGYYVQLKTSGDAAMSRLDYDAALRYYEQAKALNVAVDKSELDSKIYKAKQGQLGNAMADLAMTDVGYGTYHGHFMLGLFLGSTSIEGAPPFDVDGTALISMPIHVENYYNLHITKWLGIDFGGELTLPIVFSYDNIVDGTFTKASVVSAPIRAGLNLGNVLSAFYVIQWDKVKAEHRINGSTVLYGTESMIQSNGYGVSIGWTKTKDAYYRLNYMATSAGNEEERDFPFLDNQSISLDFGMNLMAIKAFYKKQTINDGEIRPIEAKYWGVAFGFRLPF